MGEELIPELEEMAQEIPTVRASREDLSDAELAQELAQGAGEGLGTGRRYPHPGRFVARRGHGADAT